MPRLVLAVLLLTVSALPAAEDEVLPGAPGHIVIPAEDTGGTHVAGVATGIYYGGRFGFFLPFSQENYLHFDSLAWRFEGLVNLEGGDWKAMGTVGLYLGEVEDNPDFENVPGFFVVPFSLGAYYEFGGDFSPYVGGGVGFTIFNMGERRLAAGGREEGFTELLFMPHLAAGVDLFRAKNFRLNAELRLELAWSTELAQVGGFSILFGIAL
jgi:opacity protein-like surface antigen